MSKFGKSKKVLKNQEVMAGAVVGGKTYSDYEAACMRWARDLAERRGTTRFQICDVKPEEIRNFLEWVKLTHRSETVHQYCAALQKLENMTNERFEKPRRSRENVTDQRGPAYSSQEADRLISGIDERDQRQCHQVIVPITYNSYSMSFAQMSLLKKCPTG